MFFNLTVETIEARKMTPTTRMASQSKKLNDFEHFLVGLFTRLEMIEVTDELVIFSNSDNEKIELKR